ILACLVSRSFLPPRRPPLPSSPRFPYTSLFRSHHEGDHARVLEACRQVIAAHPRYRPQCQRYLVMALGGLGQHGEQEREGHDQRSEEHTSELQSRENLVCRLLLEKKKKHTRNDA